MSTIKVTNLQNASAASPAIVLDANSRATLNGLSYPTEGSLSGRNRVIGGCMRIDQRNAGAATTVNTTADTYSIDRFLGAGQPTDGVFTLQRSTTAPTGFSNSLLATVTTADASIGAAQYYFLSHKIEGFNCADLGFGTASASTVTLSFWVRSSLTGTFSGALSNGAYTRAYPFTYTINAANTFEYKTITIAGDSSGTWLTDNGIGLRIYWDLGVGTDNRATAGAWTASGRLGATGSTNWISTNGATFYITGVQLEAGSVATPFERRSYGQELMLAQRYYQTFGISHGGFSGRIMGTTQSTGVALFGFVFPVKMRATPTTTAYGNGSTTGNFNVNFPTTSSTRTPADFSNAGSGGGDGIAMNVSNTGVNNTACWLDVGVSGNQFSLAMSAEL